MQHSLTVLLPVKNVQSTLAATVQEILEVLSELPGRIELLIIDDGSTDATSEIATELTWRYPQVRAICNGQSLGMEAAINTGLQESSGEIVFINDQEDGAPLDEIVKTWKASTALGHFFFRMDAAEKGKEIRPVHVSKPTSKTRAIEDYSGRDPRMSSRPIRPNFLVRSRKNTMGE
ncbi:MAG TPA: glycosyltransferase [Thermoguttaceae bacterium]